MLKVENVEVWGFEHAIRGMRNPMNSWQNSDSEYEKAFAHSSGQAFNIRESFSIGKNDLELMRKLYKGGPEHRKYMRQIFVSMDIIAPLYWWKEFDTYKVGTCANSCSTMHKIHAKKFDRSDFSTEHLIHRMKEVLDVTIANLNACLGNFLETKDNIWWWQMIQLLPTSYNQRRTVTMNYENVVNMLCQRNLSAVHKLDEWKTLSDVFKELPYIREIIGIKDGE